MILLEYLILSLLFDAMKTRLLVLVVLCLAGCGCLALAIVHSGCATGGSGSGSSSGTPETSSWGLRKEYREGPKPESYWNSVGLWYRVSSSPPTYLPKGYGRDRSRNESAGKWVVDDRDGKRLFVPHRGAGGVSQAVLMGEARKVTARKGYELIHNDQ